MPISLYKLEATIYFLFPFYWRDLSMHANECTKPSKPMEPLHPEQQIN